MTIRDRVRSLVNQTKRVEDRLNYAVPRLRGTGHDLPVYELIEAQRELLRLREELKKLEVEGLKEAPSQNPAPSLTIEA